MEFFSNPDDPMNAKEIEEPLEEDVLSILLEMLYDVIEIFDEYVEREHIVRVQASGVLDALLRQVDTRIEQGRDSLWSQARPRIEAAFQQGDKFGATTMNLDISEASSRGEVLERVSDITTASGYVFKGFTDEASKDIREIISQGVINDTPAYKIRQSIIDKYDTLKWKAQRIVKTETSRALVSGAKDRYRREGIEWVEWLAGGGEPCEICADLHGQQFELGKEPACPQHPNCYCTLLSLYPWEVEGYEAHYGDEWEPEREGISWHIPGQPRLVKTPAPKAKAPVSTPTAPAPTAPTAPRAARIDAYTVDHYRKYGQNSVETAVIRGPDGKIRQIATGNDNSVFIRGSNVPHSDMVHNHPRGIGGIGSDAGLSYADVYHTVQLNGNSETAIDSYGYFMRVERPPGGWPSFTRNLTEEATQRMWNDTFAEYRNSDDYMGLLREFYAGKITKEEMNRRAGMEWSRRAINKIGLWYTEGTITELEARGLVEITEELATEEAIVPSIINLEKVLVEAKKLPPSVTNAGVSVSEKAARAAAAYTPNTKGYKTIAEGTERIVATTVVGKMTPDKYPFDVIDINGRDVIEVKTFLKPGVEKITMRASSIEKKVAWLEEHPGSVAHTVLYDMPSDTWYYKSGVGSYRPEAMRKLRGPEELIEIFGATI